MGLATVATVVGLAYPYPKFSWCSAFHFFFFIFRCLPDDLCVRNAPSSQALEILAGSDTPPARRRRATGRTPSSSSAEPAPLAANHLVSTRGEVGNTPSDPVLPTGILDQVVARVTTEVTRQLQPLLSGSSAMQSDVTLSTESAPSQHGPPASQAPTFVQPSVLATASQGQTEVPVVGHPIQQAVTSVQADLSGEQGLFPSLPRPQDPFTSINLPVDARVAMKLKTKIWPWQQEYIDFGSLLVILLWMIIFNLLYHTLALEPLNKPKNISSIDTWLQAFHVFVGVYASRYPNEAPGLMKYGSTIQDIAVRGHNWRFYDENFRFLRQSQATSLPWGSVHWELWLRSQSPINKLPTSVTGTQLVSPISIPRGYCFKYHRGGDYAGFSFKHTCCKCEGAHRALHCNFRGLIGNPRISSQARAPNKSPSSSTLPQANSTTLANTRKNQ